MVDLQFLTFHCLLAQVPGQQLPALVQSVPVIGLYEVKVGTMNFPFSGKFIGRYVVSSLR